MADSPAAIGARRLRVPGCMSHIHSERRDGDVMAISEVNDDPRAHRAAEIARAARRIFSARGYDGAAIADIARAAGVAEGTIYNHFASKRDLLQHVMRAFHAELTEAAERGLRAIPDAPGRLRFLIRHHLDTLVREEGLCRLFVRELRVDEGYFASPLRAVTARYAAVVERVVAEGAAAGELRRDLSARLIRDLLFGTLEHVALRTMGRPREDAGAGRAALDAAAEDLATLLLRATAPAEPPPRDATAKVADRLEAAAARMEAAAARIEGAGGKPNP